jgi:hypothetical protein
MTLDPAYKASLAKLRKRANKNNRVMDSILGLRSGNKRRGTPNRRTGQVAGSPSTPPSEGSVPSS